jgi:hypothetical protein
VKIGDKVRLRPTAQGGYGAYQNIECEGQWFDNLVLGSERGEVVAQHRLEGWWVVAVPIGGRPVYVPLRDGHVEIIEDDQG